LYLFQYQEASGILCKWEKNPFNRLEFQLPSTNFHMKKGLEMLTFLPRGDSDINAIKYMRVFETKVSQSSVLTIIQSVINIS
jgi:hypothetical protein